VEKLNSNMNLRTFDTTSIFNVHLTKLVQLPGNSVPTESPYVESKQKMLSHGDMPPPADSILVWAQPSVLPSIECI